MELLGAVAAILLTQVGYASGVILGKRREGAVPGLLDLGMIVSLWALILLMRPAVGKWPALLLGLVAGGVVGVIVARLVRGERSAGSGGGGEVRRGATGLRAGWKWFALELGNYQGRVFMGLFYFLALNPFALLSRLLGDPLRLGPGGGSFWVERARLDEDLDRARSQF